MIQLEDKQILTTDDVAQMLGFTPYTIREMAKRGDLPARKLGREWRFSREAIVKWIEVGGQTPDSDGRKET